VCGLDGRGACSTCGRASTLELSESLREKRLVDRCPACGGEQFYLQSDFNQRLGLAIVVLGAALAPFTPYYASLFVAAALDAALYLLLPRVTICYRCQAHFRGFAKNPRHEAYDIHVAEQYGTKP
jgi:DNA-directed RNA polymerase subunit RPC12/RpoP